MDRTEVAAALSGRRYKTIDVFGVPIRLRSLNSLEAGGWTATYVNESGDLIPEKADIARQKLVALCWVDDSDAVVCPKIEDLSLITSWDESALRLVFLQCLSHIGAPRESISKNSSGASGFGSPSCSPAPSAPSEANRGMSTP
jgi:hypothetical protein